MLTKIDTSNYIGPTTTTTLLSEVGGEVSHITAECLSLLLGLGE